MTRPVHRHTWQTLSRNWDVDVQHVFNWTREALLLPLEPDSVVIASYAAAESGRNTLGIKFASALPQLTPETGLGAAWRGPDRHQRPRRPDPHRRLDRHQDPPVPDLTSSSPTGHAAGYAPEISPGCGPFKRAQDTPRRQAGLPASQDSMLHSHGSAPGITAACTRSGCAADAARHRSGRYRSCAAAPPSCCSAETSSWRTRSRPARRRQELAGGPFWPLRRRIPGQR